MFKSIKRLFEVKVNNLVVSQITPEGHYQLVAKKIIDTIDSLEHRRVDAVKNQSQLQRAENEHRAELEHLEDQIRFVLNKGEQPAQSQVVMALQRKRLVEGLAGKIENEQAIVLEIQKKIVTLGEKHSEVKAQLQIIHLNKVSESYGIALAEDVKAAVDHLTADINTLVLEVDTFAQSVPGVSVSDLDAEVYLASLSGK